MADDIPFHSMNEDHHHPPEVDDFFDTSQPAAHHNRYNLASERFIFDGEEADVIVSPSSLANPYSGSTLSEPLILPPFLSHNNNEDNDDDFSADHPLALPLQRLQRTTRHELSGMNRLNLCILGLYVTVSILFGSGVLKWLPSPWAVTTLPTYETLLTPSQWAGDYLWIPVLALEGIFVGVQLLPLVRARPEVVEGVGHYWFYIALTQSLATLLFCLKWIIPAWVALAINSLCLLLLHLRLKRHHPTTSKYDEWNYWVFRFPFDVHLGWNLPLLAARGSMIFRHYGSHDVGLQLGADIVAMALLLPCAGAYLVRAHRQGPPAWVVPLLILWAYIGIACRLMHTPAALVDLYGKDIVVAVRGAAWCFAAAVSLMVIPSMFIWVAHEFLTIHVVQLTDDEDVDDEEVEGLIINDPSDAAVVGMTQF